MTRMKRRRISAALITVLFLVLLISACSSKPINEAATEVPAKALTTEVKDSRDSETPTKEVSVGAVDQAEQQQPQLPKPDVQLPTLPIDKSILSMVQKLDEMIMDEAWLEASYKLVYEEVQNLEERAETSMSGTPEDQIKAIMTMINGVNHFKTMVLPIATQSMKKFTSKYNDDYSFGDQFRETYYAAEEQINGPTIDDGSHVIKDRVKRSEVSSHFRNGYMPSRSSDLRSMEELVARSKEVQEEIIGTVVSQVNVDMMVADYQKGKALSDLLNGSINKLNLVKTLDKDHAEINSMLDKVAEKRESRMEEVRKALVEYRFPDRDASAPSDASGLESRMKNYLSKFKYTSSKNYEVLDINVASDWIDIHHALTGKYLYSQIDYYVAVPSTEDGLIDVLLVTGKTGGPHRDSFSKYSVGGIGQMLPANL